MGFLGTIVVLDIKLDVNAEQTNERSLTITCDESKATVAGWSYLSKYIIAGHEDGSVSQYDAKVRPINPGPQIPCSLLIPLRAENSSTTLQLMKTACQSQISSGHLTEPTSSRPPKTKLPK